MKDFYCKETQAQHGVMLDHVLLREDVQELMQKMLLDSNGCLDSQGLGMTDITIQVEGKSRKSGPFERVATRRPHDLSVTKWLSYLRARRNHVMQQRLLRKPDFLTEVFSNMGREETEQQTADRQKGELRQQSTQENIICHNLTESQEQLISLLVKQIDMLEYFLELYSQIQTPFSLQTEACSHQAYWDGQCGEMDSRISDLPPQHQNKDHCHYYFAILWLSGFYLIPMILFVFLLFSF